jgi:hypothetical protein
MAEHGAVSGAYTHKHLISRPRAIISSILSSGIIFQKEATTLEAGEMIKKKGSLLGGR